MSKMRLARPSSALARPMSADVHMSSGASRVAAPFTVYNPKGGTKLPVRPHSSCEPGRTRDAWDAAESGYDSLAKPASLDDIENILDGMSSKAYTKGIKRRYLCNTIVSVNGDRQSSVPAPSMSHFDVKVMQSENKVEHLRMYYCDFFNSSVADPILTKDERTIEVEKMCEWLVTVSPRSRFDAYPLWILTKDMLRRFISKEICLLDKEAKARESKLDALEKTLSQQEDEMKAKELTLSVAKEEAQLAMDLAREVEVWKSKATQLESQCEGMQSQIDRLTTQLENQELVFAKRMDAKVLDVKAKVESIWEKQIESMRAQAERARVDLELEKTRFAECHDELEVTKKELADLKESLNLECDDTDVFDETVGTASARSVVSIGSGKIKRSLSSAKGQDLLVVLKDLFTNKSIVADILCQEGSVAGPANRSEVESVLRKSRENGARYLDQNLSQPQQWDIFRNLVGRAAGGFKSTSTDDLAMASSDENRLSLLPIILHLALSGTGNIQALLPRVSHDETDGNIVHSEVTMTAADIGFERSTSFPSEQVGSAENVSNVLSQLEQKTSENAMLRLEIDGLLKQLDGIRENGGLDTDKFVDSSKSLKRSNSSMMPRNPKSPVDSSETIENAPSFHPTCLRVYNIDDRMLKGKVAKPMPVAVLMNLIATAYEAKARADAIDDRKGNKRQHFPDFLRDFFLNKYGVRSLSFLNFKAFILGIQQSLAVSPEKFLENLRKQPKISDAIDLAELQSRLRIFGIVSGIHAVENWSDRLGDFVLGALGKLFSSDSLKESLEPKDQRGKLCVDVNLAMEATKDSWGKHGFDSASCSALEGKILLLAQREAGNLLLYDWLGCMVQEWLASSASIDEEFRRLFALHDADGNGTMDLEEFNSVLQDTTPALDESDILKMFAEALLETGALSDGSQGSGDIDSIHPQAFSYVARRFQLLPRKAD